MKLMPEHILIEIQAKRPNYHVCGGARVSYKIDAHGVPLTPYAQKIHAEAQRRGLHGTHAERIEASGKRASRWDRDGLPPLGTPPFGFALEDGRIVKSKDAEAVVALFALAEELNTGATRVARVATLRGLGHRVWSKQLVHRVLRNPVYRASVWRCRVIPTLVSIVRWNRVRAALDASARGRRLEQDGGEIQPARERGSPARPCVRL